MWSYKIIKNYYTTEEELDMYGSDGWELVCVRGQRHYFKKWVEPEYWLASPVKGPEPVEEVPTTQPVVEETVIILHTDSGNTGPIIPVSNETL